MPKLSEILGGKRAKVKQASLQTQEQQEFSKLLNEALTNGTGPLSELFGKFNEEDFNKGVRDPALKNFQETILPQIMEKYIGSNQVLGTGAQRGALKAGTDLQSQLAQLMYQAQQGQKENQLKGAGLLQGTKAFENLYRPKQTGAVEGFLQGAASAGGKALGKSFTGGVDANAATVG